MQVLRHACMCVCKVNSRDGVVPEYTNRFGSLLRLQQGVLHGDGGLQDGRKRRTLAVHWCAHYGCVDHWTVGEPGNINFKCLTTDLQQAIICFSWIKWTTQIYTQTHLFLSSCPVDHTTTELTLVHFWWYSLLNFFLLILFLETYFINFLGSHIKNTEHCLTPCSVFPCSYQIEQNLIGLCRHW